MADKALLFLGFLLAVAGCADIPPAVAPSGRVTIMGTYSAADVHEVSHPGSATGKTHFTGPFQFHKRTTFIAAKVGTSFGIGYVIVGPPVDRAVHLRVVRRFPDAGVLNPRTKQRFFSEEVETRCVVGTECFSGYVIDEPWLLVPGTWAFEVWHDQRQLIRQEFQVAVQ